MKLTAATARSLLFVPADRLDRLAKAMASGAEMIILDLEDAVPVQSKAPAREAVAQRWRSLAEPERMRIAVRINAAGSSFFQEDLRLASTLALEGLGGVMLAKTEAVGQLDRLRYAVGATPILPLVESAVGFAALDTIARAQGVARLVFGHLDFQLDLGMACSPEEPELDPVRFAFAMASRLAGLPGPVDGVTVDIRNAGRLEADVLRSGRFGFSGKLCIHPAQVQQVNMSLAPSQEQVDWARRVLAASQAHGTAAFQFEGAMVDAPVLARARSYLPTTA